MAGSHIFSVLSKKWRVVDSKHHRHRRLVDGNTRQRFRMLHVCHRVADFKPVDSDQCANIARPDALHFFPAHPFKSVQFLDALARHRAVLFADAHFHALAKFAAMHTANGYPSHVRRIIQRRNQHLRRSFIHLRRRYVFDNGIQQRNDIVGRLPPIFAHPALLCRTIYCGKIQLFFRSVQIKHQVEHHFVHFVRTTIRLVHLVYHNYRLQSYLNGLLQHKASLRHRTLESIHQKQASIGHVEHALHFAAKIGVSRSVDDIYFATIVVY